MKIRFIFVLLLVMITFLACKKAGDTTYQNEGSPASPVPLSVGITHPGTIASFGTSYYTFVAAGLGAHTIGLTNTRSDLSWDLFDNTFANIDWCDNFPFPGANDEIKQTVSLTNGATYYLMVDEWDYVDGTFSLTITYP
jgi:hypothetical protein